MPADGRDEDADEKRAVSVDDDTTVADIIEEAEPTATDGTSGQSVRADDVGGVSVATDEEDAVAGSFAPDMAVMPQTPARENVLFVALGAYLTIVALAQTIGVAPTAIVGMTVAVVVGTLVCYGILVQTTPDT